MGRFPVAVIEFKTVKREEGVVVPIPTPEAVTRIISVPADTTPTVPAAGL